MQNSHLWEKILKNNVFYSFEQVIKHCKILESLFYKANIIYQSYSCLLKHIVIHNVIQLCYLTMLFDYGQRADLLICHC